MGTHDNIGYWEFPVQNTTLGQLREVTKVSLASTTSDTGRIVRDDLEDPLLTMIELDDGTVVLGTEADDFSFPEQGSWLGLRADVIFGRDASRALEGTIVRDDEEAPLITIIKLDIGRYVTSKECQYSPMLTA